jgi:hypothetical protein
MDDDDNEVNIRGFSWFGLLFIIILSIYVCVIAFQSAVNYGTVLDNDDDKLPDTRGSLTFYLWVNVIVGFAALYIFVLFLYKLFFGNRNVYKDAFEKTLKRAYAIGDIGEIQKINECKEIGFGKDVQACSEFHNTKLKAQKVSYYLENARYVGDNVGGVADIHETAYENLCELKDSAIDCIKDKFQPMSTEEIYKAGGVTTGSEFDAAKKYSRSLIQLNNGEIMELDKKIKNVEPNEIIDDILINNKKASEAKSDDFKAAEKAAETALNAAAAAAEQDSGETENKKKEEQKARKEVDKIKKLKTREGKMAELLQWGKSSKVRRGRK